MTYTTLLSLMMTVALLCGGVLHAQEDHKPYGPQPTGAVKSKTLDAEHRKAYEGNSDVLVLPGLVADRKERKVDILVEATGLAGGAVAEFLLVDQSSSHGYEALLWSFAKPSDVHAALLFIGLRPGAPYNPRALRFFSDGDPVDLFTREEGSEEVPIEELILEVKSGEPLPQDGFVFAGSIMLPLEEGEPADTPRYAADRYDPRSVASIYNEPTAVLDVPRTVQKGEAYGNQVVNPDTAFNAGDLLTVVMRPRLVDGAVLRPRELSLRLAGNPGATNIEAAADFWLGQEAGEALYTGPASDGVLKALVSDLKTQPEGRKVLLQLDFQKGSPLASARDVAAMIAVLETTGTVVVQPPLKGQFYYRAFVPNRRWRDPAKRPAQPWELHLQRSEGGVVGKLVLQQAEVRGEGDAAARFTSTVVPVATPEALREQLDADTQARADAGDAPVPAALLTFVEEGMTVDEVMAFLRTVIDTNRAIYIFVGEEAADEDGAADGDGAVDGDADG